ncbi:hypothetical protein [Paraburkholderia sp. JPY419]|uniref:hypothetical protein n=1 Tax=Paraburkholderia sp. JPY419 TaxID=667660 RepID=UPI003D1CE33F
MSGTVIVTVAGLFMWLNLLRMVPARVAASVQFLQPVFGIAAASLITMVSRNEVGNRARNGNVR